MGKAPLRALKALTRWVEGVAGASTQNSAGPRAIRSRISRAAAGRQECGSPPAGIDAQLVPQSCGQPMAGQ